jgi:hypothetical protein
MTRKVSEEPNVDAFEQALAEVLSGRATLEDYRRPDRDGAGELAPLLEAALTLHRTLAPRGPSAAYSQATYVRLLNQLRAEAARARAASQPARRRAARRGWVPRFAYALASLLLVLAMVGASAGVVYAANDSLPGDALYGVKRGVERARLALSTTPSARASFLEDMASERLQEIDALLARGRVDDLPAAVTGYQTVLDEMITLTSDEASGLDSQSLAQLEQTVGHHLDILAAVLAEAPEQARPGLERALERSQQGLEVLQTLQEGGSPSDLAPGKHRNEDLPSGPSPAGNGPPDDKPGRGPKPTPGPPNNPGPPNAPGPPGADEIEVEAD